MREGIPVAVAFSPRRPFVFSDRAAHNTCEVTQLTERQTQEANGRVGVGLLGLGTVGAAVFDVLDQRGGHISVRAGGPVDVRRILVKDPHRPRPGRAIPLVTFDPEDVFDDPEVAIVVELIGCSGGNPEPALSFIRRALESGRHVVTANKRVLAGHAGELNRLAERRGVSLMFEGAVGGAIPIVRAIQDSLAADHISSITGILNGTTNFVLTQMATGRATYPRALRRAQELGYAEADPSSDVEGHDAAYKLALLAGLCFGHDVDATSIPREGIRGITRADVAVAARLGYVVKLLARARRNDARTDIQVYPALVRPTHPLARVEGPFNAVMVKSDLAGDLVFYGQGAGGVQTASAVVADIISAALRARNRVSQRPAASGEQSLQVDVARGLEAGPTGTSGPVDKLRSGSEPAERRGSGVEAQQQYLVHIRAKNHPAMMTRALSVMKESGVRSCASVTIGGNGSAARVSLGIVTKPVTLHAVQTCVKRLSSFLSARTRAFPVEPES
jgi:homoserine dehydrogenase